MPDQQPISINEQKDNWDGLQRTLNYMFKDVYSILDEIQGRVNKTFSPSSIDLPSGTTIPAHNHKATNQGGDYPWADITEGNVTLLQALSQIAAGADAVAVSAISAAAGADSIDRAAFNTVLGTLVTEINAIKDIVNNIWDQLQNTGIMT